MCLGGRGDYLSPSALQAGIHPKVVYERLGHATVSITLVPRAPRAGIAS